MTICTFRFMYVKIKSNHLDQYWKKLTLRPYSLEMWLPSRLTNKKTTICHRIDLNYIDWCGCKTTVMLGTSAKLGDLETWFFPETGGFSRRFNSQELAALASPPFPRQKSEPKSEWLMYSSNFFNTSAPCRLQPICEVPWATLPCESRNLNLPGPIFCGCRRSPQF